MTGNASNERRSPSHFAAGARFLVTGGAGFIGSNLVHHLVEVGAEVRVLDDLSTGHVENLEGVADAIDFVEGSITDPTQCADAVKGIDFVLHQAALPSVPRSVAEPGETHAACATGTLNMLVAAKDGGVRRFVYASSSSAYGNAETTSKSEDLPVSPLSPYAVAKVAGEQYARAFHGVYGFETVALRYFNIFGPRQDPKSPYSAVIPLFITHALEGTSPTINGDGRQTRDFTHVRNAVGANLRACVADSGDVAGEVFNVGCGAKISVLDLWHRIRELTDSDAEAVFGPPREGDVRDSMASLERARRLLGYSVEVELSDGLRDTVEWYAARHGALR